MAVDTIELQNLGRGLQRGLQYQKCGVVPEHTMLQGVPLTPRHARAEWLQKFDNRPRRAANLSKSNSSLLFVSLSDSPAGFSRVFEHESAVSAAYRPPILWTRSAVPYPLFRPRILCLRHCSLNLVVSGLRVHKIENSVSIDTAIETSQAWRHLKKHQIGLDSPLQKPSQFSAIIAALTGGQAIRTGREIVNGVAEEMRLLTERGFVNKPVGTHSSRTIMLGEFSSLLADTTPSDSYADLREAVIVHNSVRKSTSAGRDKTFRHLREFYALNIDIPIYAALRRLWDICDDEKPMLAMLCASAPGTSAWAIKSASGANSWINVRTCSADKPQSIILS